MHFNIGSTSIWSLTGGMNTVLSLSWILTIVYAFHDFYPL